MRDRRVDPLAERVEVLPAVLVEQDDLAVEHVAAVGEPQLGEVAGERAAVTGLEVDVLAVDERDRAEAVPLGLVDSSPSPGGQLLGGAGELGEQRGREGEGHVPQEITKPVPRERQGLRKRGVGRAL